MRLRVRIGQHSTAGRKSANQDFHGACIPEGAGLTAKGVAVALADGISSSETASQASQAAVAGFLDDYYCTPDAWSVKQSAQRVLAATNSWLYAQTQHGAGRYDKDRGWVCTLSAVVIKGRTAHVFHVGDTRIYLLQGRALEQLTTDHRVRVGSDTYLGRALGIASMVEIDYLALPVEVGDTFILATDGVHEYVTETAMVAGTEEHAGDLDAAARHLTECALAQGSPDNLTVQVLCIDELPRAEATEAVKEASGLPLPPELAPRMLFEGYRLVRELHASSRSHAWLAIDEAIQVPVVIKVPATDQREDTRALERLMLEEWVARRVDSAYLLKAGPASRKRQHLFTVMEYVQGQTLAQWMIDHPRPTLEEVRGVVEQIARGLRVLHRAEMVHQDVRPENVMIDGTASVKVIDFGSIRVAGIEEAAVVPSFELPGLAQYMAPELFLGGEGTARSDLFSLAVIAYQMLTGRLPYGMEVPKCRSLAEQKRLRYQSLHELRRDLPAWVDDTLRKALHPEPHRRHGDVSEFAYALQHPDPDFRRQRVPLAERDPLTFWRLLTLILAVCCVVLLGVVMRLGTPAH